MRYRIYSCDESTKEFSVEIEIKGIIYRICDDHGRVVFGIPYTKNKLINKLLSTFTKVMKGAPQ